MTSAGLPTVSVVIPNYNHGALIGEALDCAVNQTVPVLEVIVIDDASEDDSLARIESAAARSPLIRIIRHERNLGVVAGMIRGLQEARGDFVLFSAADDCLDPAIIERSMSAAATNPDVGVCFSDAGELLPSGERRIYSLYLGSSPVMFSRSGMVELLRQNPVLIPSTSAFYNRRWLQQSDAFDDDLRWRADGFALLAMSFRHGACYVPRAVAYYRVSDTSYSSNAQNWTVQRKVIERWLSKLDEPQWSDIREAFRMAMVLPDYSLAGFWLALRSQKVAPRHILNIMLQIAWSKVRPMAPLKLREGGRRMKAMRGRRLGRWK